MICTKSAGNEFLLVINTNLPPILHRFQVMADYWWSPANIAINDISLKLHWFLWPTFLRQKVSVYLKTLLRNPPRKQSNSVKLRSR